MVKESRIFGILADKVPLMVKTQRMMTKVSENLSRAEIGDFNIPKDLIDQVVLTAPYIIDISGRAKNERGKQIIKEGLSKFRVGQEVSVRVVTWDGGRIRTRATIRAMDIERFYIQLESLGESCPIEFL